MTRKALSRFVRQTRQLGPAMAIRLFHVQVVERFLHFTWYPWLARKAEARQQRLSEADARRMLRAWRRVAIPQMGQGGPPAARLEGLVQDQRQRDSKASRQREDEALIAAIDQDGYFLPHGVDLRGLPCVTQEEFVPRTRFLLSLMSAGDSVVVRKDYRGHALPFLREFTALYHLNRMGSRVPALLAADFEGLTITTSFLVGPVLRKLLADRGGYVEDRDVVGGLAGLSPDDLMDKRLAMARGQMHHVFSRDDQDEVLRQIERAAAARVVIGDVKFGNILIERTSGKPHLIDFDLSRHYPHLPQAAFDLLAERDRAAFNALFDRNVPTFAGVTRAIDTFREETYAPVYVGKGLSVGNLEDVQAGWGKWHFILKRALGSLKGKRLLDLGANNANVGLQALRAGASEVVGIEMDRKFLEQGRFLIEAAGWADGCAYNFRYVEANMRDLPRLDLGRFDVATALCSLYYLEEDEMRAVVGFLSTCCRRLLLQCNHLSDLGRSREDTYRKATLDYAVALLTSNGYGRVRVVAPRRYPRPIAIGFSDAIDGAR